MYICACVYVYLYVYTCVYIYIYVCVYKHICICVYMCIPIYFFIYMYSCARKGLSSDRSDGLAKEVLNKNRRASPTPFESLAANLLIRVDDRCGNGLDRFAKEASDRSEASLAKRSNPFPQNYN